MEIIVKILVFACIGSILFAISASQSFAQIEPQTIAGMWLFDEGKGEIAGDSSGNGNDGTILGPEWVDGKIGKALKFDGSDDYVDCGNGPSLDLTDRMTFVAWVNHPKGTEGYVIIKNTPDDALRQYGFLDYVSNNSISLFCNTGAGREHLAWDGTIDDDTWHHVAMTIDNTDVELFVDGVSEGTKNLDANIVSTDATVWIGKRKPNNYAYTGIIDEVAVFNAVLSEDVIGSIMNDGLETAFAVSSAGKLATTWSAIKKQP